jgi:hypothetical protein
MVRDTFQRLPNLDSVGLDCAECSHFAGPSKWPDREQVSRCSLHDLSLAVELNPKGYKASEWFCRGFEDAGHTVQQGPLARLFGLTPMPAVSQAALGKLDEMRLELRVDVLYGFSSEGKDLKEIPFAEIARNPA